MMKIIKTKDNNIYYAQLSDDKGLCVKVSKIDDDYILNIDNADLFFFAQRKAKRIQHQFKIPNIPCEKYSKLYDIKLTFDKSQLKNFLTELAYIYNKFKSVKMC